VATYARTVRRGLPRTPGGDPWPPAGEAPIDAAVAVTDAAAPSVAAVAGVAAPTAEARAVTPENSPSAGLPTASDPISPEIEHGAPAAAVPAAGAAPAASAAASAPAAAGPARALRRGLPRTPGGEPWPPAGAAPIAAATTDAAEVPVAAPPSVGDVTVPAPVAAVAPTGYTAASPSTATTRAAAASDVPLRRGLPRVAGGDPWPPAGFAPGAPVAAASDPTATPEIEAVASSAGPAAVDSPEIAHTAALAPAALAPEAPTAPDSIAARVAAGPLPFTPTVFPGRYAFERPAPKPEPRRIGPFTAGQWVGAAIVTVVGLLFAGAMVVFAVRWLLSLDALRDWVATYPGEYHLPVGAPVGFPAWVGWQHFFNVFLMVLIIRSGLQVRHQKKPPAFWSPRWNPKRKISIALWLHQSLDILWLVNGLVFVVLLFVTGQWLRIVPTSWEVFPNAVTAVLKYISLDWPTEDGWVNYNSIQQLTYFATVFLAAPLAAITGVRMSGIWPKNATRLNKIYPVEWARKVHFPVMIYFVLFIVVHVTLVFATGALRNLNHMYAGSDEVNWVGFSIFAVSMLVIVGAWVAARPLVLAPIAKLFGSVSSR
jgi:thiosulfate reductase cytochrome b subunit